MFGFLEALSLIHPALIFSTKRFLLLRERWMSPCVHLSFKCDIFGRILRFLWADFAENTDGWSLVSQSSGVMRDGLYFISFCNSVQSLIQSLCQHTKNYSTGVYISLFLSHFSNFVAVISTSLCAAVITDMSELAATPRLGHGPTSSVELWCLIRDGFGFMGNGVCWGNFR